MTHSSVRLKRNEQLLERIDDNRYKKVKEIEPGLKWKKALEELKQEL